MWWARPAGARELLALLDSGERGRCARFDRDDDRSRYLAAHALARLVLAGHLGIPAPTLAFEATCRQCGASDHGKPRLGAAGTGVEFSLSHSGARVVLAVARDVAVGVDVERLNRQRDFAALAPAVLSGAEQLAVAALPDAERAAAVLRYWTRKEALLKATGDGLGVAPTALTVTPPDAAPALVAWEAAAPLNVAPHLVDLSPGPGHVASLAMLGRRLAIVERDGDELLATSAG